MIGRFVGMLKGDSWQQNLSVFDPAWYLSQNPDVAANGVEPLAHYLQHGFKEGRKPHPLFDPGWYLSENPDVAADGLEPLTH